MFCALKLNEEALKLPPPKSEKSNLIFFVLSLTSVNVPDCSVSSSPAPNTPWSIEPGTRLFKVCNELVGGVPIVC